TGEFDRALRRREAMDVEAAASRWTARDRRDARSARPADQARHDVAGRDPQLLRARVSTEAGRAAGPLHRDVVHGDENGPLPSVLCRILRHRPCAHGRRRHRDGANGGPALALRARGGAEHGRARRRPLSPPWLQRLPRRERIGARAEPRRRVRQARSTVRRHHRRRRRALHPRFDPAAAQGSGRGLRADHAVVHRSDRRGRHPRPDCLHQEPREHEGAAEMSTLTTGLAGDAPQRRTVRVDTPSNYLNAKFTIGSWLGTHDHKRIAILFAVSITAFFFIGGAAATMMRLDLATPAGDFVKAETYNKLFTMHGVIMVWFFLIPSIPATLGNFLVPLMIGARDLAFPRLNLTSWYLYIGGSIFTIAAMIAGGVDTGWTFYAPFSTMFTNTHVIYVLAGVFVVGFSSILTGLNIIVTVHTMRAPGMTWF